MPYVDASPMRATRLWRGKRLDLGDQSRPARLAPMAVAKQGRPQRQSLVCNAPPDPHRIPAQALFSPTRW
jgi:hypothetical protein